MGEKKSAYNLGVVLVACIGSFTYGYVISILGNTLSKPDFYTYMELDLVGPGADYATSIIAAWNCLLYVGGLIGCLAYPTFSNRYGRKLPIAIGSACILIGGALQAGAVNPAMMCVARVIIGLGIGNILGGIPLYQAEVAPPHSRGLMVGLHPALLGYGTALAQWMGVAFFNLGGQVGWRVPLAIQCIFPAILFCLIWYLPESPRWLYSHGKAEQAEKVMVALHRDHSDPSDSFAHREFDLMKAQIDYEMETKKTILQHLKTPSMRRRFLLGFLTMSGTQFSGLLVILTYSQVIYAGLGFGPLMIGVLTGIWSTINGTGNFIGALIVDKVGRKLQMTCGYTGCAICLVCAAALTANYAGTDTAGNKAATFFVFMMIVVYTIGIESASFVYTSEIFPSEVRAQGVSFAMVGLFIWSILFTAVAAPAFQNIGWRFYIVFACTSAMMVVIVTFLFPETKGYTLEQLTAVFGENVVELKEEHEHIEDLNDMNKEKVTSTEIVTA